MVITLNWRPGDQNAIAGSSCAALVAGQRLAMGKVLTTQPALCRRNRLASWHALSVVHSDLQILLAKQGDASTTHSKYFAFMSESGRKML